MHNCSARFPSVQGQFPIASLDFPRSEVELETPVSNLVPSLFGFVNVHLPVNLCDLPPKSSRVRLHTVFTQILLIEDVTRKKPA